MEDIQRETSPPDQDKCTNAAPIQEEHSLVDKESPKNDPEEAEDIFQKVSETENK